MINRISALALVLAFAGLASAGDLKVVVGFKGEPDAALLRKLGASPGKALSGQDALRATLPASAIARLRAHASIAYVEADGIVTLLKGKPANPGNGNDSDSPPPQVTPWGIAHVGAPLAGNSGDGIKVAVIDTGINLGHSDLAANIKGSVDFTGSRKGAEDEHGHGTHVAGTIAGIDNTIGVVGVAPKACLYAVRVLDRRGAGRWSDLSDAITWCVDNGMNVGNMSLGGSSAPSYVKTACDNAQANDVLLVAAAGNSGDGNTGTPELSFPAAYDSVVSVAAIESDDDLASFSNSGAHVEVSAPGVGVYSTYKKDAYATLSGTSMASPHAAGVAAVIWKEIASPTAASVRTELQARVRDLSPAGRDTGYGFGVVDLNP